jgi:hypothetical protein
MGTFRRGRCRERSHVVVVTAALAFAAAFLPASPPAHAQVSAADQRCIGCHRVEALKKNLSNGEVLPLHVPADAFAKSVHAGMGCGSCHSDVNPNAHPPSSKEMKSRREYAVAMGASCRGCHGDKFQEWEKSVHATLAREGHPAAPICTDCHRPHEVTKAAAATREETPCKTCHADVFNAYAGSMHAQALRTSPQSHAPICSGCHSAHDVKPVSLGEGPKAACLGCHAGVLGSHQTWLPNAARHFEAVACAACHAPGAQRKVDLMLYDAQSQTRVTEQKGVPLLEPRRDGQGLDAVALWNLLQALNRDGIAGKTTLRGRLEVRTGPEAHRLADKSQALRDCRTCHRQGSEPFQSVTISVVGPDGRRVKVGANPDVLSSVISIDSVSGFYAIGGTRIWLLDVLLILAVLAGIGVPVGHMTMGWVFKRYWLNNPQAPGSGGSTPGGDAAKPA